MEPQHILDYPQIQLYMTGGAYCLILILRTLTLLCTTYECTECTECTECMRVIISFRTSTVIHLVIVFGRAYVRWFTNLSWIRLSILNPRTHTGTFMPTFYECQWVFVDVFYVQIHVLHKPYNNTSFYPPNYPRPDLSVVWYMVRLNNHKVNKMAKRGYYITQK